MVPAFAVCTGISRDARWLLPLAALLLIACRGGDNAERDSDGGGTASVFFPGSVASASVIDGVTLVESRGFYDVNAVEEVGGAVVLRTELDVVFRSDATLADLDRALASVDAAVTASIPGVSSVAVRIPDPGSVAALGEVIASLESDPAVWMVRCSEFGPLRALPPTESFGGPHPDIDHHLAVGAHAAWNLRGAIREPPRVIVDDLFGGFAPTGVDAITDPTQYARGAGVEGDNSQGAYGRGFIRLAPRPEGVPVLDLPPAAPHYHGYFIAGVVAGEFGGMNNPEGRVTGLVGTTITLDAIDAAIRSPVAADYRRLQMAASLPGPVVLNYAVGWFCEGNFSPECQERSRREGAAWALKVRQAGLEDRLLLTIAGGNAFGSTTTVFTMETSLDMIAAAVRDDLVDDQDRAVPPLRNTFAVSSVRAAASPGGPPVVECLNDWSYAGGNISAVGDDVFSHGGSPGEAFVSKGTSFAAPQVGGLAAMVWGIRPELTAEQVRDRIIANARPVPTPATEGCSTYETPAPHIDAYRTLLSLDVDASGMRVRRALLDLDGDGRVEASDLLGLLSAQEDADGALDYGRADLNGDGRTGGESEVAFDLNASGETEDRLNVLLRGELAEVFESRLRDIDIACYYAFSPLLGMPGQGAAEVEDRCAAALFSLSDLSDWVGVFQGTVDYVELAGPDCYPEERLETRPDPGFAVIEAMPGEPDLLVFHFLSSTSLFTQRECGGTLGADSTVFEVPFADRADFTVGASGWGHFCSDGSLTLDNALGAPSSLIELQGDLSDAVAPRFVYRNNRNCIELRLRDVTRCGDIEAYPEVGPVCTP